MTADLPAGYTPAPPARFTNVAGSPTTWCRRCEVHAALQSADSLCPVCKDTTDIEGQNA